MGVHVAAQSPLLAINLSDERVTVRPFESDDIDLVREASADPMIPLITTVPASYSESEGRAFIERQHERMVSGAGWSLAIVERHTRRPVGQIGLWIAEIAKGRAELGYWIVNSGRGCGSAGHALTLLSDWAFVELDVDRLTLYIDPSNVGSMKTAERAGFAPEALLRRWERVGGATIDMVSSVRFRESSSPTRVAPTF